MKKLVTAILVVTAMAFQAESNVLPRPNDIVLESNFDTLSEREAWSKANFAKWVTGYNGTTSLYIHVPSGLARNGNMIQLPFDLTQYRGCRLLFECMAKADNVSEPEAEYLGVKFMLYYESAKEGSFWGNENHVYGTFDWRKLRFTKKIAADATNGKIDLGLQGSSGTVWFDTIKITVIKPPMPSRPKPPINPQPAFKGHNLPRLRGVMSPNVFHNDDMKMLGAGWKANVIRWQITRNWSHRDTDRDLAEYDSWIDDRLAELDKVLESCRQYGIKVVVDLHSPPGGRYANNDMAIFYEAEYQDYFVALWEKIARRYKGNPMIWGYDLINEPIQNKPPPEGLADYLDTQVRTAKAIRAIDTEVPVFIEAAKADSPEGFLELEPVDISNVIYEVHIYVPSEFTHQGVHRKWMPTEYPGKISNVEWNKEQLRRVLQPVREFQLAYNVHIYVGEFSAIRWAPGAANYLRDCIELFEEYGWDWTYHAYREYDGWSVEYGSDPMDHSPAKTITDRKALLLNWFGKNVKPGNMIKRTKIE